MKLTRNIFGVDLNPQCRYDEFACDGRCIQVTKTLQEAI